METQTNTALIIAVGAISIIMLVLLAVTNLLLSKRKLLEKEKTMLVKEKQYQLSVFRVAVETEEAQKLKFAYDLHDQVIPSISLRLQAINDILNRMEKEGHSLQPIRSELDQFNLVCDEIRNICHSLAPHLLRTFGLLKSLEIHIEQMEGRTGSRCAFRNNTVFSGRLPFSETKQLHIYRICLELMNNIRKHAGYDYLELSLDEMDTNFVLNFIHDGKGITDQEILRLQESSKGIGLKSIESRLLLLEATINYYTEADVAYIKLTVPVK